MKTVPVLHGLYSHVVPFSFGQKMAIRRPMAKPQLRIICHFPAMPFLNHSQNHFLDSSLRYTAQKSESIFLTGPMTGKIELVRASARDDSFFILTSFHEEERDTFCRALLVLRFVLR